MPEHEGRMAMAETVQDFNDGRLNPDPLVNGPVVRVIPTRLLKAAFVVSAGVAIWALLISAIV